jgi:hypothetical protein
MRESWNRTPAERRLATYREAAVKRAERMPYTRQTWRDDAAGRFARKHPGTWQSETDASRPDERAYYCDAWPKGWRLLGRADEVPKREGSRRVDHTGWYTDPHGDTGTLAGYVLQLPARGGKPQYLPGTAHTEYDGVTVYPLDRYDSPLDAAGAADHIAEREAESEREYNAAWQAGSRWAQLGEEVAELRRGIIRAVRQFKEARKALQPDGRTTWTGIETGKPVSGRFEALCDIIRSDIADDLESIRQAREEREKLAEGDADELGFYAADPRLAAAFSEGAGQ